jgi:O-antigen ligase
MRNNGQGLGDTMPDRSASVLVGVLPAAVLTLPSGASVAYGLLVLFSLWRLAVRSPGGAPAPTDRVALAALAAVPVGISFSLLTHANFDWNELEPTTLLALAIPVFLYLRKVYLDLRFFVGGSAIGAIGAALMALWQTTIGGLERADGLTHWLPFGEMSLLLAFFSLAGFGLAPSAWWRGLSAVGFLAGMTATVLSGTRGAWIAIPVLLVLLLIAPRRWPRRQLAGTALAIAAACAIGFSLPQVHERVRAAVAELGRFGTDGNFNATTSVGIRLELWRGAATLIAERPLIGHGFGSFPREIRRLYGEGQLRFDGQNRHAHDQYLHTLAEEGVVGLGLLVFYLGAAARRFWTAARLTGQTGYAGLAGLMLTAGYGIYGLTQVFFAHNNSIIFLAACTAILLAATRRADDGAAAIRPAARRT